MAVRALKACPYGCPDGHPGACPRQAEARERRRQGELSRERGSAASRGYDKHHRRWREAVLARDLVCVLQQRFHAGQVRGATVADHIVPLSKGGGWELTNGRGLCRECHGLVSVEQGVGGFRARRRARERAMA